MKAWNYTCMPQFVVSDCRLYHIPPYTVQCGIYRPPTPYSVGYTALHRTVWDIPPYTVQCGIYRPTPYSVGYTALHRTVWDIPPYGYTVQCGIVHYTQGTLHGVSIISSIIPCAYCKAFCWACSRSILRLTLASRVSHYVTKAAVLIKTLPYPPRTSITISWMLMVQHRVIV